jgi:hypothetical protein
MECQKNRGQSKMSKRRRRAIIKQKDMVGDPSNQNVLPVQDSSLVASTIKEQSMTEALLDSYVNK